MNGFFIAFGKSLAHFYSRCRRLFTCLQRNYAKTEFFFSHAMFVITSQALGRLGSRINPDRISRRPICLCSGSKLFADACNEKNHHRFSCHCDLILKRKLNWVWARIRMKQKRQSALQKKIHFPFFERLRKHFRSNSSDFQVFLYFFPLFRFVFHISFNTTRSQFNIEC